MIEIHIVGLSFRLKMMSVRVHSEGDVCTEELDENRMPVLIIQQAAQHEGIGRGRASMA